MSEREYILFTRDVSQENIQALVDTLHNVSTAGKEAYLLINCNGGNVQAGIYGYNMMRALPTRLIAHNVGNVDSVANVLFLAAECRYAAESSVFMFHGVSFDRSGQLKLDERYFKEHLDSLTMDHNRLGKIISEKSRLELSDATALFGEQRVYNAEWAKDKGIIHEIADFKLPRETTIHKIT